MTTPNIQINPMSVTTGSGLFQLQSGGYIQGFMEPDPATRYQLKQGVLLTSETLSMVPGVAIRATVPSANPNLGANIARATSVATIQGFSIGNQAYNGIITPTASVPTQAGGMSVQYVLLGSGARICVGVSAALAATLTSGTASITSQVSWDITNQELVPYTPAYSNVTITGAVWASTSGGQITYTVGTDLTAVLVAGALIDVTGVVSTGGTGGSYNGSFVVVSVTATTVVVTAVAAAGFYGTYSSGGTILAGGGALACKIENVNIGNSQTIYADTNGLFQWNPNGNCALIQI